MSFEKIIIEIKKIHSISTNKDSSIFITYKGTSGGITKPWNIKIDSKEADGSSEIEAALNLFNIVKDDLTKQIATLDSQANAYRAALSNIAKTN
jgi:hypothetical protein